MSLIIEDDYIESVKKYVNEQCESLSEIINEYIDIMDTVVEEGISEGKTAEALKEFLNQVQLNINYDGLVVLAEQNERFCTNFISKVDKADKDLY